MVDDWNSGNLAKWLYANLSSNQIVFKRFCRRLCINIQLIRCRQPGISGQKCHEKLLHLDDKWKTMKTTATFGFPTAASWFEFWDVGNLICQLPGLAAEGMGSQRLELGLSGVIERPVVVANIFLFSPLPGWDDQIWGWNHRVSKKSLRNRANFFRRIHLLNCYCRWFFLVNFYTLGFRCFDFFFLQAPQSRHLIWATNEAFRQKTAGDFSEDPPQNPQNCVYLVGAILDGSELRSLFRYRYAIPAYTLED